MPRIDPLRKQAFEIVRSPQFQAIRDPIQARDTLVAALREGGDEKFNELTDFEAQFVATNFLTKSNIGLGRKILEFTPIIGTGARAAREASETGEARLRPLTQAGAEAIGFQPGTPFQAGLAESLRDIAETGAAVGLVGGVPGVAGGLAKMPIRVAAARIAGRVGTRPVGSILGEALKAGATKRTTSQAIEETAVQVAQKFMRERGATMALQEMGAGGLFGLTTAVETNIQAGGEAPLGTMLAQGTASGIGAAALGLAFLGVGGLVNRLGQQRAQAIVPQALAQLAEQTQRDAGQLVANAGQVVEAIRKAGGGTRQASADLAFRAVSEPLAETNLVELGIIRRALTEDPRILETPLGIHLLRMQRGRLTQPEIIVDEAKQGLRVQFDAMVNEGNLKQGHTDTFTATTDEEIRMLGQLIAERKVILELAEGPQRLLDKLSQRVAAARPGATAAQRGTQAEEQTLLAAIRNQPVGVGTPPTTVGALDIDDLPPADLQGLVSGLGEFGEPNMSGAPQRFTAVRDIELGFPLGGIAAPEEIARVRRGVETDASRMSRTLNNQITDEDIVAFSAELDQGTFQIPGDIEVMRQRNAEFNQAMKDVFEQEKQKRVQALFAEMGFLDPNMSEDEIRDNIRAGLFSIMRGEGKRPRSRDKDTLDQLVEDIMDGQLTDDELLELFDPMFSLGATGEQPGGFAGTFRIKPLLPSLEDFDIEEEKALIRAIAPELDDAAVEARAQANFERVKQQQQQSGTAGQRFPSTREAPELQAQAQIEQANKALSRLGYVSIRGIRRRQQGQDALEDTLTQITAGPKMEGTLASGTVLADDATLARQAADETVGRAPLRHSELKAEQELRQRILPVGEPVPIEPESLGRLGEFDLQPTGRQVGLTTELRADLADQLELDFPFRRPPPVRGRFGLEPERRMGGVIIGEPQPRPLREHTTLGQPVTRTELEDAGQLPLTVQGREGLERFDEGGFAAPLTQEQRRMRLRESLVGTEDTTLGRPVQFRTETVPVETIRGIGGLEGRRDAGDLLRRPGTARFGLDERTDALGRRVATEQAREARRVEQRAVRADLEDVRLTQRKIDQAIEGMRLGQVEPPPRGSTLKVRIGGTRVEALEGVVERSGDDPMGRVLVRLNDGRRVIATVSRQVEGETPRLDLPVGFPIRMRTIGQLELLAKMKGAFGHRGSMLEVIKTLDANITQGNVLHVKLDGFTKGRGRGKPGALINDPVQGMHGVYDILEREIRDGQDMVHIRSRRVIDRNTPESDDVDAWVSTGAIMDMLLPGVEDADTGVRTVFKTTPRGTQVLIPPKAQLGFELRGTPRIRIDKETGRPVGGGNINLSQLLDELYARQRKPGFRGRKRAERAARGRTLTEADEATQESLLVDEIIHMRAKGHEELFNDSPARVSGQEAEDMADAAAKRKAELDADKKKPESTDTKSQAGVPGCKKGARKAKGAATVKAGPPNEAETNALVREAISLERQAAKGRRGGAILGQPHDLLERETRKLLSIYERLAESQHVTPNQMREIEKTIPMLRDHLRIISEDLFQDLTEIFKPE